MSADKFAICNSALTKIGVTSYITAFDGSSKQAIICAEQYDKKRKYLLAKYFWDFAIGRAELVLSSDVPAFEYGYYHELPDDHLRPYYIYPIMSNGFSTDGWAIEGKLLASNSEEIKLVYVKDEEDTEQFTALFDEVLAYKIAEELAYPMVQSNKLRDSLAEKAEFELRQVRTIDAMQGTPPNPNDDVWLRSRRHPESNQSSSFGPFRSFS